MWLQNNSDPGARLLRWRLKLNNYNFEIKYTPGKTNFVADELSRNGFCNFIHENPLFDEKILPTVVNTNDDDAEDVDEEEDECLDFHPRIDRECITNDVEINGLIAEQHSSPIGGHRGINATYKAVVLFFNIKGLSNRVINFVKG